MRYLLIPFVVLSATDTSFSQIYEVVSRDLGRGYTIAGGGTITVVDGLISEWDIPVTGKYPHRFTADLPDATFRMSEGAMLEVTEESIVFTATGVGKEFIGFSDNELDSCLSLSDRSALCFLALTWSSKGPPIHNSVEHRLAYRLGGVTVDSFASMSFANGSSIPIPQGATVIARIVPEPSGMHLGLVGVALFGIGRKRCRAQREGAGLI